jgi:hypothetical protein
MSDDPLGGAAVCANMSVAFNSRRVISVLSMVILSMRMFS